MVAQALAIISTIGFTATLWLYAKAQDDWTDVCHTIGLPHNAKPEIVLATLDYLVETSGQQPQQPPQIPENNQVPN